MITLHLESSSDRLPEEAYFIRCCQAAWLDTSHEACINIIVVDEPTSRKLNRTYRNQDKATNVLAFEGETIPGFSKPIEGELVLCAPVIEHEAQYYNIDLMARWAHMLIHGTLHLQGFDHQEKNEADIMRRKEINILKQLGYSDPYPAMQAQDKKKENKA